MVRVSVLASGSKGNCSYLETNCLRILIDLGISCLSVEKRLQALSIDPKTIQYIFLTHTHIDHVSGLKVFLKKYPCFLVLSEKMYQDVKEFVPYECCIFEEDFIKREDLEVSIFKTSHDVSDARGYIFKSEEKELVYITDTGYIPQKNYEKLQNKDLYIMESNHDVKLLMEGKYPYYLKQRILSDIGHLSNKDSAYYLSHFIGDHTKKVILIHLSEENNQPEIALSTLRDTLERKSQSVEIIISKQDRETELLEV